MNQKRDYIKENLGIINQMIEAKRPKFEIARVLGVKYATLDKYLKEFGIEYAGNPNRKGIPHLEGRTLVEEYISGRRNTTASNLRNKLIEEGIKEYKCEKCGRTEWEGRPIPLELHHKNFNHNDNRLENLQVLCSNCHSLAHDYCNTKGKKESSVDSKLLKQCLSGEFDSVKVSIAKKINKTKVPRYCKYCGKELKYNQKNYCSQEHAHIHKSKMPSIDELKNKLDEFAWNKTKTGKYFGVSDVAINKWIKKYNIIK